MSTPPPPGIVRRRRRSVAWVYYLVLAVFSVITAPAHPAALVVAVLCGLYSRYLYNGGRVVVWIW
ncbi:MAG TPA: hypothetical protein VIJ51_11220 [Solirubrobacteraceae bacterium]